jgi:hypothetical protein
LVSIEAPVDGAECSSGLGLQVPVDSLTWAAVLDDHGDA